MNFASLMKLAGAASVALALSVAAPASAATLGTFVHDYGNGAGEYNPGGNDVLSPDYVTVSDQSSERFNDAFDFSSLDYSAIDSFALTLTFTSAGPTCPFLVCGLGEIWSVRINGSAGALSVDDVFATLISSSSPQTVTLSAADDIFFRNAFATALATEIFSFWFAEDSIRGDEFRLYEAELTVYGTPAPVPVPAAGLMLLAGLGGLAALRRKRNAA